jgi:Fe2+ transport system protein B
MAEVYAFAKDVDLLSAAKKHLEDTVTTIVQQTAKCAMFVREYTGNGFLGKWFSNPIFILLIPFVVRLVTDLTSEYSKTIEYFVTTFEKLQQSLNSGLQKYAAFGVAHIESITTHTESMTTNILKTVQDSGAYISPVLLPALSHRN